MRIPCRTWGTLRSKFLLTFAAGGLLLLGLLLSSRGEARAKLAFEKTEIYQQAMPFDTEVIARFPFRNSGNKKQRILEVKTDCGCTTAKLAKDTFGPGEEGEIVVTFNIGVRTGLQRKAVLVKTDAPEQPYVPLSLVTSIPEVLRLATSVLLWTVDEPADSKSLVVKTSEDPLVKELLASTDSPFLTVAIERVGPAEFSVRVTPSAGRRNISAALQLEAVLEGDRRKRVNAFVRVR